MEGLVASLKVAKSLLGASCVGVVSNSESIAFSGSIHDSSSDELIGIFKALYSLPAIRCLKAEDPALKAIYPLEGKAICCCVVEPLADVDASLIVLSDRSCPLDLEGFDKHLVSLTSIISSLLSSKTGSSDQQSGPDQVSHTDLLRLNNKIPTYIALVDQELRYEFINDAYAQRFSLSKKDAVGTYIKDAIPEEICSATEDYVRKALSGVPVKFEYALEQGDDGELRFINASYVPRINDGEVTGLYLYMQDITSQKRTLNTLKRLHEVTANFDLSHDEKLQNILQVGVEQFSLPIGLISRIEGDDYYVEYSQTPGGEVLPGARFDLNGTYCIHTLKSDAPTSYFHTAISDIKEHPCYKSFGLEAYIGIVVYVAGKRWGTLNFSSPDPKSQPFGDDDYEVMKLLSQWVGNEITRHQDELNLSVVTQQQRLILEAVHEGIFGVDISGNITFANSAACHILGYSVEELLSRNVIELLSHRDKEGQPFSLDENPIQNSLLNGKSCSARGEYFNKRGGSVFVCEYTCVAMRSESGEVEGVVISFQDKTEQIQKEKELVEQKSLFESLFVHAPEAIILVGNDRKIKMVNPAFSELFGYQEDDVIGKSTQMLYAEENDFVEKGAAYDQTSQDVLNRYRVSYKNSEGNVFHSETIGSMIHNSDGSFGGYIGHVRDVSERLEVEQKMIDTHLRLSIATDTAGIGVWEVDLKNNTLHWDDWMYRLYGFNKEERKPPYQVWTECVYPEDRERLKSAFVNLGEDGGYFINNDNALDQSDHLDTDFKIIRQDGQLRYLKSNATIIYDKAGEPSHIVGVNMDITSRKETEVVLREASDRAISASKAKSDFLATMSHEIRTPLNGVLGMAELLADTSLDSEQRQNLAVLRDSGESLLELINGILDFSKIEAGHLAIEREDFNLEKIVYDVARLLMLKAEEKGIDLLIEFDNSCPRFVVGDAFRIKQVLINLVSNAIKFTHTGHVLVSIKGNMDSQGIAAISMSVIDTGVGIAEEIQPHLFNAFVQADSSTTRKFGGTGLGLAITKQLAGLMGGNISLSSEEGVGSTFTVTLSLPESHAISNIEKMDDEALLVAKKTLVIDDNETNLTILKNQLKACDIHADIEVDPLDGLARIEQAIKIGVPYQIIVLDYMMPELDGLMLSKLIRNISVSNYKPTILMTSSADFLSQDALSAAGVNVCIPKPMSGSVLKQGLIQAVSEDLLGHQIAYDNWSEADADVESQNNRKNTKQGLILVVEDMKANMAVACGILSKMGFDIIEAENGAIGVAMWKQHQPDLIFMDLHMPVMDGLAAMRSIRQAEKNSQKVRVPILALTADVQQEALSEVFRAGGDGLVPKPFKQKEFIEMLNKWLPDSKRDLSNLGNENAPVASSAFESVSDVVIDKAVLNDLKQLLGNDFTLLIDAFFGDAEPIMVSLNDMLVMDCESVAKVSHSLKSISQNVGAISLSTMAAQLEQEARNGDVPDFVLKTQELSAMYQQVKNELQSMMADL
ncbi:PAS domain S-box protein [Marinomonas sp. 2405UD66-6]|uniref:PAS domain S-box protein n=1 Tax=Marinomonas sp. 2405UD66-6 TaxID=3391834 RepID=UPI0039C967EF